MKHYSLIVFAFLLIFFTSCEDDNTSLSYEKNLNAAKNNTLAEDIFQDIYWILHMAGHDSTLHANGQKEIFGATAFYTKDPDSSLYRIFYPSWNVECPDGLVRKGQITLKLNGDFSDSAARGQINFINFAVENIRLIGKMSFINLGPANDSVLQYSFVSNQMVFHMNDSINTFEWKTEKEIHWTEGTKSLYDFSDDRLQFIGSNQGNSIDDYGFVSLTINPLIKDPSCSWIHGGNMAITTNGLEVKQGEIVFYAADSCNTTFDMYYHGNRFYEKFHYLYRSPFEN